MKIKKETYNTYRNALFIKLMLYSGLRTSEALAIKIGDFEIGQDKDVYQFNICGKGGKNRIGYIPAATIEDEIDYFKNEANIKDNELVMRTNSGKKWNRSNAFTVINGIYKKAGIKKEGLHLLRHTLAMRLVQNGASLVVIKKILGHSNIATTTIYAKATEQNVTEAIKF